MRNMGIIRLRLDVIGVSLLNETPVVTLFLLLAEPLGRTSRFATAVA